MKKQKIERVNDLNSRQWLLYTWLTEKNELVSLKQIYNAFENHYPDYRQEKTTWANSSARRQITEDLNAIANSKCIYRVLVRSVNGVGFLSKEETEKFLANEHIRLTKELITFSQLSKKAGLDGQLRLVFANEREMIEAFSKVGATNG